MGEKSDWKESFKIAIPYLVLLFGILAFSYAVFGTFINPKWKEFWSGIGKTLVAGGVFALLLKSIQFLGVFKEELCKIIYDAKFLENRKDLPDVWGNVSRVLFNNKFPTISKDITEDVKNIYFPTTHNLYYDNFKQTLEIELLNPIDQTVKVTQHSEFIVYPTEPHHKFPMTFNNWIKYDTNANEVLFRIIQFKINGKDSRPTIIQTDDENCLKSSYSVDLSGEDSYKFETTIEKQYSLLYDNAIGVRKDFIIHNFELKVLLKGSIAVEFLNIGTVREFKITKIKNENYKEYTYNGIIYPKQGYILFVRKKI